MSDVQLKARVIVDPLRVQTSEDAQRVQAERASREPVGNLSGQPLNAEEKRRVLAMIDEISDGVVHDRAAKNVSVGRAFFEAHRQQAQALDGKDVDASSKAVDAGLKAAESEQRVQSAVGRLTGAELNDDQKRNMRALIDSISTIETPQMLKQREDDALAKSLHERMKDVDWEKAKPDFPKSQAPNLDESIYNDLEKLSKSDFDRAAVLWEQNAPQDTVAPTFADRRYKEQMAGLKVATAMLDEFSREKFGSKASEAGTEPNTIEAVRERKQEQAMQENAQDATAAALQKSTDRERPNQVQNLNLLNEVSEKPAIPKDMESHYIRVGDKYHYQSKPDLQAFVDRGNKLETHSNSARVSEDLVRVAETRGWEEIRVKGAEDFRRQVWLEANLRGIKVQGYKPNEVDLAHLVKAKHERTANEVEKAERVQKAEALRKDTKAAERHPDLAGAVAVIRAAELIAHRDLKSPDDQKRFVDLTRERIATHVEQGGKPPTVDMKERTNERDNSQEQGR